LKHVTTLVMLVVLTHGEALSAQPAPGEDPVEARLWIDGGPEPVVQRGERVRIQYRTAFDAFTAVFRIDTDGRITLLHPSTPWQDGYVRSGRDHMLVLDQSPFWTITDDPGIGYLFLVASPDPLDLSAFEYHPTLGWDLRSVGSVVYDDPYLAMDDFVAALIPSWDTVPYALDFVTYHVGEPRSYPRFLCYDCHTPQSYAAWNPYAEICSDYRIVVYDDPYYYPAYRYSGLRTVYPRPIPNRPRYALAVRGSGEAWAPIVRVREAPRRPAEFKETPASAHPSTPPVRRSSGRVVPAGTQGGAVTGGTPAPRRSAEPLQIGRARPTPTPGPRASPTPERRPAQPSATGGTARSPRPATRIPTPRPDPRSAPARPDARNDSPAPTRRPAASAPRPTRSSPPAATARPRPAARPPAAGNRPAAGSRPTAGSRPAPATTRPARAPAARSRAPAAPGRPSGG
jgi:hypothetical protein